MKDISLMFNSTLALLHLSLQKTFYNLRSISNKISLLTNQNWFVMFLPVLRLKLLLICPGHIYFVSLDFLHIFTPPTPQTSACDSCWRCELLGYMKADKSGMALSYLSLMHSQLFQNPFVCSLKSLCLPTTVLCSSQPHQSFPKTHSQLWKYCLSQITLMANDSSESFYHCDVRDSKEGTGEISTMIHKKQYMQSVSGWEFGLCAVGPK